MRTGRLKACLFYLFSLNRDINRHFALWRYLFLGDISNRMSNQMEIIKNLLAISKLFEL